MLLHEKYYCSKFYFVRRLIAFLLLMLCASIHAQFFTVIAKNGLNVREERSIESKIVGGLKFGDKVTPIPDYRQDTLMQIGGRDGYWIKIEHGNINGFVFTGFLNHGNLFVESDSLINKEYRICALGSRCDDINYDDGLIWYSIDFNSNNENYYNGIDKFESNRCVATLNNSSIELDFEVLGSSIYNDREHALPTGDVVSVKDLNNEKADIAIGVSSKITTTNILNYECETEIVYNNLVVGKFIHPYEDYLFHEFGKYKYYLSARELVTIENKYPKKEYFLFFDNHISYRGSRKELNEKSINSSSWSYESGARLGYRKGPRLIWKGDVNGDLFPDFIMYTPYMIDTCGGSVFYTLYVSEIDKKGKVTMRIVAEDEHTFCDGC